MADEDFHEIQLNGKQLVFLFMAGTVAAVVIFLCGLMVGRNVQGPRLQAAAVAAEPSVTDPTRPADQVPPPSPALTESSTPVTAQETLTYSSRLEAPNPADETLQEEDTLTKAPPPAAKPVESTPPKSASLPPAAGWAEPDGSGWSVQVQAVKTRGEADSIARRLGAKGYPTFVADRGAGLFGVRVGKYPTKQEADTIKTRLEKEEQYARLWVTR